MNRAEIINEIKQIAANKNIKVSDETFSKPLKEAGIDSLSAMSLIVEVEQVFNVTIPDEKLMTIKTLNQLVELISDLHDHV
jgi:acyl carrier protein